MLKLQIIYTKYHPVIGFLDWFLVCAAYESGYFELKCNSISWFVYRQLKFKSTNFQLVLNLI